MALIYLPVLVLSTELKSSHLGKLSLAVRREVQQQCHVGQHSVVTGEKSIKELYQALQWRNDLTLPIFKYAHNHWA